MSVTSPKREGFGLSTVSRFLLPLVRQGCATCPPARGLAATGGGAGLTVGPTRLRRRRGGVLVSGHSGTKRRGGVRGRAPRGGNEPDDADPDRAHVAGTSAPCLTGSPADGNGSGRAARGVRPGRTCGAGAVHPRGTDTSTPASQATLEARTALLDPLHAVPGPQSATGRSTRGVRRSAPARARTATQPQYAGGPGRYGPGACGPAGARPHGRTAPPGGAASSPPAGARAARTSTGGGPRLEGL